MFIEYGLNEFGELIYIDQVARGATALVCPYCSGLLTAKKGQIKAAHFAHTGETCRQLLRDQDAISLPAYDRFNLHLNGKALKQLQDFADDPKYSSADEHYLERLGVVKYNEWLGRGGGYELTKNGKLIVGQLSLNLFIQFQEPLIVEKHDKLVRTAMLVKQRPAVVGELDEIMRQIKEVEDVHPGMSYWNKTTETILQYTALMNQRSKLLHHPAYHDVDEGLTLDTALVDLRLYRAQWRRLLACSLYFLEINGGELYKIGVTMRPIEERLAEISVDLIPHIGTPSIKVLGTWPGRGNVELYFKHRYKASNHPLGALTEYYKFDDVKSVLLDLRRMKKKEFSELELAVLAGEPPEIEQQIYAEQVESRRRASIRRGMARAARRGRSIGRPSGGEDVSAFLLKPQSQVIMALLTNGIGIRETARQCGVSINTVRKVRDAINSPGEDRS